MKRGFTMSFSDSFTQGGQTQLHKLHMIKQVVGATVRISFWVFLVSFIVLVCLEHALCDFLFLGSYTKAWFLNLCPSFIADLSPSASILNRDGSKHLVSNHFLLTDGHISFMVQTLLSSFIKKIGQALLISIIGSAFVSCFWIVMGRKKHETKKQEFLERLNKLEVAEKYLRYG